MIKAKSVFFCSLLIGVSFFACKEKPVVEERHEDVVVPQNNVQKEIVEVKVEPTYEKKDLIDFQDNSFESPEAHKKFLGEPLEFEECAENMYAPDSKLAVVGSDVCEFLEGVSIENAIKEFTTGSSPKTIIPLGTIVVIKSKINNPEQPGFEYMTSYQEYLNWFYEVEYDNKTGYVFGADLTGFSDDIGQYGTINTSILYKNDSAPQKFSPLLDSMKNRMDGKTEMLSEQAKESLVKNHVAFENVNSDEYSLFMDAPDDMISLYRNLINSKTPVFITTDLLSHSQHLLFDRMLQNVEETKFYAVMDKVIAEYLSAIDAYSSNETNEEILQIAEKARNYFQVAAYLLKQGFIDEKSESIDYVAREEELEKYPKAVQKEIQLINDCSSFTASPIFTFNAPDGVVSYKEDYTQYKPRGHYTKNAKLSAYFRAQMWFGRINFLIADSGEAPLMMNGTAAGSAQSLTDFMEPIALFIVELTEQNLSLYDEWSKLFNPITELIGLSDDLSFNEIMPLWELQNIEDFNAWVSDKGNLHSFMKLCHQELVPPAISGNSVSYAASEGDNRKPPMGWRLLGQRFTYDSSVHHNVSAPRIEDRGLVTGLDILKALGAKNADWLLSGEYEKYPALKPTLDEFENFFASQTSGFWLETYYNASLNQIKMLSNFSQGAGFYFTESPLWTYKAINASLGTWAELRHDTILYVKQSYAEKGGGDCYEPTYRTHPVPSLIPYVEPNLAFYGAGLNSVIMLSNIFAEYNLFDENNEAKSLLNELEGIYRKLISITEKEIMDSPIDASDCKWIQKLSASLAQIVIPFVGGYSSYFEDTENLKMALIADVFTNIENSTVLEVGVAQPNRMYVALNDSNGGKRIAVGYTFDYVEFEHPMDDRMNDSQWKRIVYANSSMEDYYPSWRSQFFEE